MSIIQNYYSNLYEKKNSHSEVECADYMDELQSSRLSEEEKMSCEELLTIHECYESLEKMNNNRTPGNDGLTKEFYLYFWSILGEYMVKSFNHSFTTGHLSTTQKQVIVTLLEKTDNDVRLIENWRPISLLNVDVKICSKALSKRMLNLLPKLIHPNQSAFVQSRNINEPLRFISDLFDYVEETGERYILFAADFQKAFDSVEHPSIFAALRRFGFGNEFIRWVRIMLTDIKSCVFKQRLCIGFCSIKYRHKTRRPNLALFVYSGHRNFSTIY